MKNKLQSNVAKTAFFLKRDFCVDADAFTGMSLLKGKLKFLFTIGVFVLFSMKGFSQLANESFESGVPATWTLLDNEVGTTQWGATSDGYLDSNAVSVNPSADNIGDGSTAEYYLVTPRFTVPTNGELHFYTKQGSDVDYGTTYQIRVSTAEDLDIYGFSTSVKTYSETNLNEGSQTEYEHKVIDLSTLANAEVYFAFVAVNNQNGAVPTGDEWFIDDVAVLQGCDEIPAANITMTNITTNEAEVTWTHPTASNFNVEIVPDGALPNGVGVPVNGNSYTFTDLESDVIYNVYVQAICDNGTVSEWGGPVSFETVKSGLSCDSAIVIPSDLTEPYIVQDNLSNYGNPFVVNDTQGSNCVTGAPDTWNFLKGDKLFMSYSPEEDGLVSIFQSVPKEQIASENCYNKGSSVLIYESCDDVGVSCMAGAYTATGQEETSIEGFLAEAGKTYIIVVSSNLDPGAGICFTFEMRASSCPAPTGITYEDLTATSVAMSWENIGGFANSWEYAVVPTGDPVPTTGIVSTSTNTGNLIDTGLVAGTTYDFYVRSICDGTTTGDWSNPYTFTTQCVTNTLPFFEDFTGANSTTPEPCWFSLNLNKDKAQWGYLTGYPTLPTLDTPGNNNDIYSSPRMSFDALPKRLTYKHRATNGTSTYSIRLSTTGIGPNNFTTEIYPETAITNSNWETVVIELPVIVEGEVNIAWVVTPNPAEKATRLSIDDILVETIPQCPNPSALAVGAIQDTSVELSWTAGESETEWEVVVQAPGAGVPTLPGDVTQPGVITDQNPYTAEDLLPATRYEYYVRANCGDKGNSEWVGPLAFTTTCDTFVIPVPYFETFNDGDADSYKFCWSVVNANGDNAQWATLADKAAIQTSIFAPPSAFDDWFISPAINVNTGFNKLEFDYMALKSAAFSGNRFGMEVLISTTDNNPASFTVLEPYFEITNTAFETKTINFESSGTVYIAFRVPPAFDAENGFSHLHLDNVSIEAAERCPRPSNLAVSNITGTSAQVTWNAGAGESVWNVAVQPSGTGLPTNTAETVRDESTYTATDLEPGTTYEAYVQASCGDSSSGWLGPITFTTSCNAIDTPFVETFNSDSTTRPCWSTIGSGWVTNSTRAPYEGDQTAAVNSASRANSWLVSPTLNVKPGQRLRFFHSVLFQGYNEVLEIYMSTTGADANSLLNGTLMYDSDVDGFDETLHYQEMVLEVPVSAPAAVNFGFYVPNNNVTNQSIFVDYVIVEDIPSCPQPYNVTVNPIIDEGFTIGWDTSGTETSWEIAVLPYGEPAPTGDVDPAYSYIADSNPFDVTGLIPASKYEVYVRAICSDTDKSEWSIPVEVVTMCDLSNVCEYKITVDKHHEYFTTASIDLYQNGVMIQRMMFYNGDNAAPEYTVFLCNGVEYSLFFETVGYEPTQYAEYEITIKDYQGQEVANILGPTPRAFFYTGVAACGDVSCPQPTDLTANGAAELSWTPGGDETQWEVALQPLDNNTLPQSGTIVNTPSYVPTADDFELDNVGTYEYFVRAICGEGDTSNWSGPYDFAIGDDVSTAVSIPVNSGEDCEEAVVDVSFRNATLSPEVLSCGETPVSDIWFEFTAESRVQVFMIDGFEGNEDLHHGFTDTIEAIPHITMTMYKELADGSLEEMGCTYDNLFVASYSTELVVGDNYKLRLSLTAPEISTRTFKLCATTPEDLCAMNAPNFGFESPAIPRAFSAWTNYDQALIPGWSMSRPNGEDGDIFYQGSIFNWAEILPAEGGQFIILDPEYGEYDPRDPNITGLYRDFDTSEITQMYYSFAAGKSGANQASEVQLFAGPPEGPFVNIREEMARPTVWSTYTGTYFVPEGQTTTRFIFRSKNSAAGTTLDALNFVANNGINSLQTDLLDCTDPSIQMSAEGTGTWISEENPGPVLFSDASSREVTVSGFTVPGTYTFIWRTRYCDDMITVEYDGIPDYPGVESPFMYCVGAVAEQLSATIDGPYSLLWYTDEVGGTGSTEAPTPDTSVAGTTSYYVGYLDANGCEGPRSEIVVEVNEIVDPTTDFTYEDVYCPDSGLVMPVLSEEFTLGGSFSSQAGLDINAETGEINVAASTPGEYTITYEIVEDADMCLLGGMSTYTITILENLTSEISEDCIDAHITLTAAPVSDAYNPDEVDYVWTDANGEVVGDNSNILDVTEYAMSHMDATVPTQFTVTVTLGGCSTAAGYTVEKFSCGEIPKGISPDGNGKNDWFDLTGFQVVKLNIFNRYGTEVYNFSGNYTKEWGGQSKNGEELPTGTYFYSIEYRDGANETGWVYINRAK
ncbi:choice-of-anchor J domain-containing protein [Mangrovimonas sp. DI 80]|uniref:choice-of-anchor J domain-containing protein n=1 Tax=Mangrovimonas sp. DI 80 TaxID=1779330 RepID=UPI00097707F6|nr:choice-of-anchor J domain-containing protein [Mangrovimonas sp. DI 80]OMP32304.1 hypothetical protein BKM32_04435 [Mangrovimonas sp. DI 80]